MTKYYQSSCSKSIFEYIKKTKRGWIIRWDVEEHTEDEYVIVTYKETLMHENPTYESITSMLIRTKYSLDAEFAVQRQRDIKQEDFAKYNEFCEQCKSDAKRILGL